MEIKTKNLTLRPFLITDIDDIHEYCSDLSNVQYMDWGPNSYEQSQKFLLEMTAISHSNATQKNYNFAIALNSSGKVIGSCSLWIKSEAHRHGGLGYILNKQFWRKGFGTELTSALLKLGFEDLKLHKISATCFQDNQASKKLLEKVGFKQEGFLRDDIFIREEWHDSLLFSILEDDDWYL